MESKGYILMINRVAYCIYIVPFLHCLSVYVDTVDSSPALSKNRSKPPTGQFVPAVEGGTVGPLAETVPEVRVSVLPTLVPLGAGARLDQPGAVGTAARRAGQDRPVSDLPAGPARVAGGQRSEVGNDAVPRTLRQPADALGGRGGDEVPAHLVVLRCGQVEATAGRDAGDVAGLDAVIVGAGDGAVGRRPAAGPRADRPAVHVDVVVADAEAVADGGGSVRRRAEGVVGGGTTAESVGAGQGTNLLTAGAAVLVPTITPWSCKIMDKKYYDI